MSEEQSKTKKRTTKQEDLQAMEDVKSLFMLNASFKQKTVDYNDAKSKLTSSIVTYLNKRKSKGISFVDKNEIVQQRFNVVKVTPTKVDWDIDKLKKKLGKAICNCFISKKYEVNDIKGLTEYLKSCGVDPKEFKKYISVSESINVESMNNLFETGRFSVDDLDGCYAKTESATYLKITIGEVKDGENN